MAIKRPSTASKTQARIAEIKSAILKLVPKNGETVGNLALRMHVEGKLGTTVTEDDYANARDALVDSGKLVKGKGRGGSVARALQDAESFTLSAQEKPVEMPKSKQGEITLAQAIQAKSEIKAKKGDDGAKIIAYQHEQKRKNNPDVGVVTPETDPEQPKTTWAYDPHIDPALQFDSGRAQTEKLIDEALASGNEERMRAALEQLKRQTSSYLNWAGKAERNSFEVDTVSLHVHERIDPATILSAIQKQVRAAKKGNVSAQEDMFRAWFEQPLPLREEIEFYKHDRGWMNRMIAGDSLLVMNSLLQKESLSGQVQTIYIDPPYGIKYGSNFQPFVNKRDVKDRKDEDLTQEPEMIKAFRDTWELGIHSYLTYLRDRLLLARELLHETGSIFVQISEENVHHVRELLSEVFGDGNFVADIIFVKAGALGSVGLPRRNDYIIWYGKNRDKTKYRQIFLEKNPTEDIGAYRLAEEDTGRIRPLRTEDDLNVVRPLRYVLMTKPGPGQKYSFEFQGKTVDSGGRWWGFPPENLERLRKAGRIAPSGTDSIRYLDDFPASYLSNLWTDTATGSGMGKIYVVQTNDKVVERCLLMTTAPGDLVLDPTCGSGTTAHVAEKWGRRWITCDTSRVAITLAKQRLMTAGFNYFELKYPHEGLRGEFIYKTIPHVTLKSIANNPEIDEIWEQFHPAIEQALTKLNAALKGNGTFKVDGGSRKGETLDFTKGDTLQEWEVPFDFSVGWRASVREPFDAFHAARQLMQKKMNDSIDAHADQEVLFDQPSISRDKLRITGPFTIEAVPFPTVLSLDETQPAQEADAAIARSGESQRQHSWRDELLKTGIRGKHGQRLEFSELETLPDTRNLHCSGHVKDTGERVVVSFGPEYAALEQRQVELAMREAGDLFPRPKMIVFCAFSFDPEASKDIDATKGIIALKAYMNTDLLTEDLKKARSSNQSFWLMGQPEITVKKRKDDLYQVEVHGFDYFDPSKGELVSGGKSKIAAWSLDTNYDERSLFPRQIFFPMAGAKDGWYKLTKDIKAELDESKLDQLHGTVSLPFAAGENRKIAVKLVDDRGIESLKVIELD